MSNKLVEDSYKLASKLRYLSNSKEGELYLNDAIDEAVAFAHGSKEPSILIELLNLNPLLYSKGILSGVVDDVLEDGSFAKTAKGKHLSALKQYALEASDFERKNDCAMLYAISSENKNKIRAHKCELMINDLEELEDPDFNGLLQAKKFERNSCLFSKDNFANMLKGFETGKMFKEARLEYLDEVRMEEFRRFNGEGSVEKIIASKLNAHLINSTLHFAEETSKDYLPITLSKKDSSERQHLVVMCALKDGLISDEDANKHFKELGEQELSEAGKACISLGIEIMANESEDVPVSE